VATEENAIGHAIMLSNDRKYWEKTRQNNISAQFSVHDNREIGSSMRFTKW
jgi:hypothetical protein